MRSSSSPASGSRSRTDVLSCAATVLVLALASVPACSATAPAREALCFPGAKQRVCTGPVVGGRSYRYELYTHCGVRNAYFAGRWWLAAPPLDDGSGNPPRGWDNPTQVGKMRLTTRRRAEFRAGRLVARFRPAPRGYRTPLCA